MRNSRPVSQDFFRDNQLQSQNLTTRWRHSAVLRTPWQARLSTAGNPCFPHQRKNFSTGTFLNYAQKLPVHLFFSHHDTIRVKQIHCARHPASPSRHVQRRVPTKRQDSRPHARRETTLPRTQQKPLDSLSFQSVGQRSAIPPAMLKKDVARGAPRPSASGFPSASRWPCACARSLRADAGDTGHR